MTSISFSVPLECLSSLWTCVCPPDCLDLSYRCHLHTFTVNVKERTLTHTCTKCDSQGTATSNDVGLGRCEGGVGRRQV